MSGRATHQCPDANGLHLLWLPVWSNENAPVCFEIQHDQGLGSDALQRIGAKVEIDRNLQNLLDFSECDSLTSLLNRKTSDDQLSRMFYVPKPRLPKRRQTHDQEMPWLAVVDVDRVQALNDRFGHM